ncbi:DUF1254 domain-containing protein [Enterobacter ludwigii]|uniref:DUF1254 domain-containing protein n=1 Tax=Enterobacter ludwigii TaxID=299767 RepID=UPI001953863B|nr:DUF1254 domain-containing protein [Enterobacter ludwigii]
MVKRIHHLVMVMFAGMLCAQSTFAKSVINTERVSHGYNSSIPQDILTPDTVQTRIGTLSFVDGVPTKDTAKFVFDNLDFLRGIEVFLNMMPAASVEAIRRGSISLGAIKSNQATIYDHLADSNPLLLTANTDTVYAFSILDLETDGPTVVEVPPGSGPGTVNDAFFRFVVDMGIPGPDRGKGGKYLIVPPDYNGELPKDVKDGGDYHIARSPSYINIVVLRGFLVDGKPDVASKMFRDGFKVYSLSKTDNPPEMEFINASGQTYNTIHANNFMFFKELNDVIQKEPINFIDPELRGLIASIGIRKGKPFEPDERMTKILTDAVATGNATARAISFRNRDPRSMMYPHSQWRTSFIGDDYRWLGGDGASGRDLDARTSFFYVATVNTPAMAAKSVGAGSQYAISSADVSGKPFDGAKSYKLNIPGNVPAKDFWSVVIYDPQTRSELQTAQHFPSKNNKRDKLITNVDGSVDLYFGPTPPVGKEANWMQTVPGKGWFTIFRLYGPLESWFDKSWKPGEIEEM